ncbi:ATP-binding protein [Kibdelosporangium phytohabitans]|nr:ATP-binding protein [Kibdelosporangium phytohabitans]MBE1468564.1 anti-sigma regulatory factor (Ser/Thr protein kinase) [Kibdelosporangium phytohabitans]
MPNDHSFGSISTRVHAWADTLPEFAAEAVYHADLTGPHVYTEFVAVADQVRRARCAIEGWSQQLGVPAVQEQDIVLAVDEAVSNAVDHAYPDTDGRLCLFAACTTAARALRVIVADKGLWRPPPVEPGFRGRGLMMMQRLAEVFRLSHGPNGTTVMMGWSLAG